MPALRGLAGWVLALALPFATGAAAAPVAGTHAIPASAPDSIPAASSGATHATAPAAAGGAARDSFAGVTVDSLPMRLVDDAPAIASHDGGAELGEPSGIAVDAFGKLYVSDAALNRVQRYDAEGKWLGTAGALGSDPGQLRRPGAVALLGTLQVAVLDRENRRVVAYDLFGKLNGTLIDLADPTLEDQIGRVDPSSLAADRGGAVYVLDRERDRILAFDFSGRYLRSLGGFGARPGSFRALSGLAIAPRGELVTAERSGGRVQRLDAGGRPTASWPLRTAPGRGALAVAVDDSARVAVADELSGRLTLFAADGRRLAVIEGLAGPRALAFAPGGRLYVAEGTAGRVRRLALKSAAGGE